MRVHVVITSYNDGVRSAATGPSPSHVRTHGIYSDDNKAIDLMNKMVDEDIAAWDNTNDKSRAMTRSDSGIQKREAHIYNEAGESVTYRVVQQNISMDVGEY